MKEKGGCSNVHASAYCVQRFERTDERIHRMAESLDTFRGIQTEHIRPRHSIKDAPTRRRSPPFAGSENWPSGTDQLSLAGWKERHRYCYTGAGVCIVIDTVAAEATSSRRISHFFHCHQQNGALPWSCFPYAAQSQWNWSLTWMNNLCLTPGLQADS